MYSLCIKPDCCPDTDAVVYTKDTWEDDLKVKSTHKWFKTIQQNKHHLWLYGIYLLSPHQRGSKFSKAKNRDLKINA